MKKFFICLLSMFLMISLAACGSGETESVSTAGELTRKLKSNSDKVIEVSEDIVLTKSIEIVGNKEIVGSGSITVSVTDMEEGYIISLSDGASLTIGGSVKLDLSSLAGGIHVKEGTELVLQDEAVVTGASVKSSNVLVEGTFTMNGGSLKHAKGHNLINKGNTTIAGGELKGSGKKYAIVYNEGTLVQDDGTIVGGYHNVVGVSGSSFEWNKGENTTSLQDAIVIEEGASIHITSAEAKLTGVYAKGLVVNGEGVIDGATMKDSMDSMVAVGLNGKLTLNDGKITEAGVHGIDNAGTLLMTDGVVFQNAHSGICNTGTLNITGGDIMNNGSKGVLNKAGVATITSADVMITGNDEGVSNEIGAYFELSAAEVIQNTDCNVYAYGGEMYIHDIALSSSKAASISVTSADIILKNVDIQGTTGGSGAHGIYMTGGSVVAKKVNFNAINGSGLRLDGEAAVFEGKNITFDNIQRNVFYVTAGKAEVDGFTTKDVQNYNVYATGGELNLANATLCKTAQNNVRTKNDTVLNLKNVEILGNTKEVAGTVYGLIIDDGTVTANNLTIKDTYAAAIRLKGGTLTANKVTITNAGKHGINAAGGVGKITNLKTSNVTGCNVYMTSAPNLTLTDAELGKCTDNSIKEKGNKDAVLNLTNVTVLGHTANALESVYGLIVYDGSVTAKNLKIQDVVAAGLRVRGGSLTADDVNISDTGKHGINVKSGTTTITNLKTTNVTGCNIYMTGDAKLTVTNAELGKCTDNSIKEYGNEKAVLNLTDVTILGHTEDALASVHGLIIDDGTVTAKNLKIQDVVSAGLRVRGGNFTAEDVVVLNPGLNGMYMNEGTADITGLKISTAPSYGVYMTGGVASITDLTTSDVTKCNVYMTKAAKLTVTGADLGKCMSHSIKVEEDAKAELNLETVIIRGQKEEANPEGYIYGILVNGGSVSANNLTISHVVKDGVCVTGGSFDAEVLNVSKASRHGVNVTGGVADIKILTTSNITGSNINVTGDAELTVTGADLDICGDHSIQIPKEATEDLILNLNDVRVYGHTDNAGTYDYGILVNNGRVFANKLTIGDVENNLTTGDAAKNGVCVAGGRFEAEVVKISKVSRYGINVTGGYAEITDLTTSEISSSNIYMTGDGELKVTGTDEHSAVLGKCGDNCIKIEGNAKLNLTNVKVLGFTNGISGKYEILVNGGRVEAKTLEVSNVDNDNANDGICVTGGNFVATDVTVSDVGRYGVYVLSSGTANITELKVSSTGNYGVYAKAGALTLNGAEVEGTTHDIYNITSELTLAGVIKADVYNDAKVTINAYSLAGSDMIIDWPANKLPEKKVGIQFLGKENATTSEENATASEGVVKLGENLSDSYAPYFNGDQMLIVDKQAASFTVRSYDELVEVLNYVNDNNVTKATITLAGDINVSSTITIPKGKNITLIDDGTEKHIVRDTLATNSAQLLFDVKDGAELTFDSTGTDKTPLLIVDGSKDNAKYTEVIKSLTNNWAMVQSQGTLTVNAGVKFTNNATGKNGGAISVTGGKLIVTGGTFGDKDDKDKALSGNYGGAINIAGAATATIENATFEGNTSVKNGGVINIAADTEVTINGCEFIDNSGLSGGAIFIANGSQVTIEKCTFSGNSATVSDNTGGTGGAITNKNKDKDMVTIKSCTFTNNVAPSGGAIYMESGSYIVLEGCTFTNNDIQVADAAARVHIKGKTIAKISNVDKSVLYVDGALEDGSDVEVEWCVTDSEDKTPSADDSGNKIGINFANETIMNASKPYISLGEMAFSKYSLAYTSSAGRLVTPFEVDTFEKLNDALTKIGDMDDKIGVIRLTGDIEVSGTITIPASYNVTIEDDGEEKRTLLRTEQDYNLITLENSSILTLRSTGTVDECKLVLDGASLTATTESTMIKLNSAVANIYRGVKLQNNISGTGGAAILVNNAAGEVNIYGAYLASINTPKSGGGIYLKGTGTIVDCTFDDINSTGSSAGAINVIAGATCNITNTTFTNCSSLTNGGVIYNQGSLSLVGTSSNAIFSYNNAGGRGGAIDSRDTATRLTITGYKFERNSAMYGGAVYVYTTDTIITDCTFKNNEASTTGGALHTKANCDIVVTDSFENAVFEGNTATSKGQAIYLEAETLTVSKSLYDLLVDSSDIDIKSGATFAYKEEE